MKLFICKNLCLLVALAFGALSFGQADTTNAQSLPVIVLSVNDAISSVMQPGFPLVVSALSIVDEGDAPHLPQNLKVKLADNKGTKLEITLTRIVRANETTQFYWMAPDTATTGLGPGHYNISVDESGGKITGWTLEGCDLNVDPSNDSSADLKSELNIEVLLLQNKTDDALKIATALTQKDPKNINAWVAMGDIYIAQNNPEKAVDAYQSALANFKDDGHEPLSILQRYRDALNLVMGIGTSSPPRL